MTNRRRVAWSLGACFAVGAVLWWINVWSPFQNTVTRLSGDASGAAHSTHAASPQAFSFRTRLLPHAGVPAASASVRIGLAYVSPDEAAGYRAWLRGGAEGQGPQSLDALATVTRWLNVPATLEPDNAVSVGPIELPAADRYVLQARAGDALRFYEASFTADNPPAAVLARIAAGLRVRASGLPTDDTHVLFRRVDGSEDAAWRSLMLREAPTALQAYDERALAVGAEQTFAPLPPGSLDVIAVVNGVESERRRVTLSAGQITTLDLDPDASELSAARSATLVLQLVEKGTGLPVKQASVVWSSARGARMLRTDTSGAVRLDGVEPLRPVTIEIQFESQAAPSFLVDTLPTWPERIPMTLDIATAPVVDGVIAKMIELEPLRWLIVETPGIDIPRQPQSREPFPVFVLQRLQGTVWRDAQAAYFRPVQAGLAVSLDQPGTVRVVALQAPWHVRTSSAVDIGESSGAVRYTTRIAAAAGRRVTMQISTGKGALAFAPVHVLSSLRGVPPKTVNTDGSGRIVLDQVTTSDVILEVPGFAQTRVPLDGTSVSVMLERADE